MNNKKLGNCNPLAGRETWIDICRGVGIILVVLGHCDPPFRKMIYGFHMPLFFILSGLLVNYQKNYIQYAKKLFKKYVFPYFLFCILNLIIQEFWIQLRLVPWHSLTKYIYGIIYSYGSTEYMPNCSPLWFLTCLFTALLLHRFLCHFNIKIQLMGCFTCFIIGILLDYYHIPKLPWNIDTALVAVTFIFFGNFMKRHLLQRVDYHWIYLAFAYSVGMLFIYLNPVIEVNFDGNSYGNPVLMLLGSVVTSVIVIILCKRMVSNDFSHKCLFFFSFFGHHTILVMAFDYLSGSISKMFLKMIYMNQWYCVFFLKIIILIYIIKFWSCIIDMLPYRVKKYLLF